MKQATLSFGSGSKKLTISKSGIPKKSTSNNPLDEILFCAPTTSKISKPKKMKKYEQLVMDCGQKSFTSIRCKSCGMVYMNGDFQDEKVHNKFCQSFKKLMKYKITTRDNVKEDDYPYKVIVINSQSSKALHKKAEQIVEFIDTSSLQCTLPFSITTTHSMFLYVNTENDEIMGCVVVERVSKAHPSFVEKKDLNESTLSNSIVEDENNLDVILSSTSIDSAYDDKKSILSWDDKRSVNVFCGINRIWVKEEYRRSGVASKLLDAIRTHFIYGFELSKSDLAFSPPTPKGAYFARKYCSGSLKDCDFLVYVTSPITPFGLE